MSIENEPGGKEENKAELWCFGATHWLEALIAGVRPSRKINQFLQQEGNTDYSNSLAYRELLAEQNCPYLITTRKQSNLDVFTRVSFINFEMQVYNLQRPRTQILMDV